MAKRQKRISGDEISTSIQEIPIQPLSVILRNGQVYFFRILKINDFTLEVADLRNKMKEIKIEDIDEIILDI